MKKFKKYLFLFIPLLMLVVILSIGILLVKDGKSVKNDPETTSKDDYVSCQDKLSDISIEGEWIYQGEESPYRKLEILDSSSFNVT